MRQGVSRRMGRLFRPCSSVLAAALVISLPLGGSSLGSEPEHPVRYVAPIPSGRGDGSSWDDAASIKRLPDLVAELPGGGEILLRADQGPYHLSKPIFLGNRGSDAPVTVRGVDPSGRGMRPLILGGRTEPYSPETAATGRPMFALDAGADGLSFVRLRFKNVGNGCFVLRGAVRDLTIAGVVATNVRRFIENEEGTVASVVGLVVRRSTILGFSKGAIRLRNDSHDVLIEDVVADSRAQDGDLFAMGFHLTETVHDVVFRRVVARNARDTVTEYHNGDGFVAERGTYGIRFEATQAIDNMDAGYDVKASDVTFVRTVASGNKRNYRVWGAGVSMISIRGEDPIRRGGTGSPAQVWAGPSARFAIREARFIGGDRDTIVFDLQDSAIGSAVRTVIRRPARSALIRLAPGAEMTFNGDRISA